MREMKDTQNNCLGMIPKDWEYPRLKYYCKISNGSDPQTEGQIPVYGSGKEIVKYCGEYKEGPAILLGRKGTLDKPRYIEGKFWNVDTAMDAYPINGINSKFLYFVATILDIGRYATVTAKPSMTQSDYYNMPIPVPPASEQEQIVRYIEEKTTDIDEAISRQKEAIEKLEEYRVNTFTFATTKGLSGNVQLKDTGLNWIPKIPEKWDVIKITHLVDQDHPYAIGDGDHGIIKNSMYQEKGIPYIRVQNLEWGTDMNLDNVVYISEELNDMIKNSTLRPNDVLFAKTGATIGKTAIVPESLPISNTTSHVGKLTIANKYNPKYIFYVLSSKTGYDQFWQYASMKATRPELSIEDIKQLIIPIPLNRHEQDEIVSFLDQISANVEIAKKTHQDIIEKLEEYKKSLIYNAVTGKIDCRNA